MKHVFVETNFLVDLLRPFPGADAHTLFKRNQIGDVRLYLPWCVRAEAKRTLRRVINEDLGFTVNMIKFVSARWPHERDLFDRREIHKVKKLAEKDRIDALRTLDIRLQDAIAQMTVIEPSPAVVENTLRVFDVKVLKPFDEMVLGAVLAKATELHAVGERDLTFCEPDLDFSGMALASEYAACGLTIRDDFDVPM